MIAADEAVGVGIDGLRRLDRASRKHDVNAAGRAGRVIAERDGLADERGVDFVHDAVEADGAVLLDLAFLLEEEDLRQVGGRELDVRGAGGPAIDRGRAGQAAVRRIVILVFDPRPQPASERLLCAMLWLPCRQPLFSGPWVGSRLLPSWP